MTGRDPHRDPLEAAHARIAELERVVAEQSGQDAESRAIAALQRERASALERTTPPNVWSMLRYMFVVFPVVAIGLAYDRDWLLAVVALLAPFAMAVGGQSFARSNAAGAARQVALIDERLAEIEKRKSGGLPGASSPIPPP
jgi:hypothetical protein